MAQKLRCDSVILIPNVHFRIIATGSQVLNPKSPWDCFRHYSAEYKEVMDFLENEKINGVVFLTGDRHLSEINRVERSGGYPLYDITSSPLTSGRSKYNESEKENSARILSVVGEQNYTRLSFTGTGKERKMKTEFLGIKGQKLAEWEVNLVQLTWSEIKRKNKSRSNICSERLSFCSL